MKSDTNLAYQVTPFKTANHEVRYILTSRSTLKPMYAASIFEAHQIRKSKSHLTRVTQLYPLAFLYTWSEIQKLDLEHLLLKGYGLTDAQIRAFASWVEDHYQHSNGNVTNENRKSINRILNTCKGICVWFIRQYANPTTDPSKRALQMNAIINYQEASWEEVYVKVIDEAVAPDLTEEQITSIENFLRPNNRSKEVGERIAMRDYLIWRMAIEFGMRKGEILAMRLEDCPVLNAPNFRIVRIEERGPNYHDPRSIPPRPKTLSRRLGILLNNSAFPWLVNEYISSHRYIWVNNRGKKIKKSLLPHNFLIVSTAGDPLSIRAADDIAENIRIGTGISFKWHLPRHAFFNRAYETMASVKDVNERNIKKGDLLLWGGWRNEQSLDIYTRRSRADRARNALSIWQEGGSKWNALI
jgi:integrase